jgi:hypothetical protein
MYSRPCSQLAASRWSACAEGSGTALVSLQTLAGQRRAAQRVHAAGLGSYTHRPSSATRYSTGARPQC